MTNDNRTIHQGRNVKRFREMLGLKQEALADQLGGDWSQKKISMLENKEIIDAASLDELAAALKVPAEAIKNFSEEAVFSIINNTFNDYAAANMNYQCTLSPLDEIRKLNAEKEELYKALLKEKDEKIALLQKVLEGKTNI
jgi:transcriptional regulator with XRE-family HTH domain